MTATEGDAVPQERPPATLRKEHVKTFVRIAFCDRLVTHSQGGSILSRHVARQQQQRQDFNTPVVTFRADDLEQLAAAYKTTPEMLRRSLHEWGVFRSGQAPAERPEVERQPPAESEEER